MGAVNFMVGPSAGGTIYDDHSDGGTIVITPGGTAQVVSPNQADGTQFSVGAIILVALVFLVLLRMGGFQTMIAASVSSAR